MLLRKLLLLVAFLLLAPAGCLLWLSSRTQLAFEPSVTVIGQDSLVRLKVTNPHGVRHLTAWLEQGGQRHAVHEVNETPRRFWFWRRNEPVRFVEFRAGSKSVPAVRNGKATLTVEAQSNDLRAAVDTVTAGVTVNLRPPALTVDTHQHYINQGGSELVTFRVSGYWTEAGVRVGNYTFRSYRMPGTSPDEEMSEQRFSLFAFPWDVPANTRPIVYARNDTGTEVTAGFWFKVFPKKFRSRELDVSDAFMQKVVNAIDRGGAGELLPRFLKVNGEVRRANNQALADLRHKTEERILWSGPFLQLTNSKVESHFADARTYTYDGKKIDEQVHLGFDLSVTRNVPVEAANDGIVRLAGDLGIYGNAVVIDHGYGLQSIYAHLSRIDVKEGAAVKKRQALGLSGSTGLAGGDHLHFSMQVDGVQVNPVEWWDAHWIGDRILGKLPAPGGSSQ